MLGIEACFSRVHPHILRIPAKGRTAIARYEGRLELTWTNKALKLLAEDDGSYAWVPPSDYRVAEVRLLHDVEAVGSLEPSRPRAHGNTLIRGDALHALRSLSALPEFSREYVGKVKLAYIDPPFNTQESFLHYDDALEHSVWLTMMRDRLMQIRELLAPDGSVWVHLDDSEVAYCRVMMDEIFGRQAFIATVVWENFYGRSNAAALSPSQNYILVYAPLGREKWRFVRHLLPREGKSAEKYSNPDGDPRGPWRNGPIFAAEERHQGLMYTITTPGGRVVQPPKGSHWRMTEPEFWRLAEEGRITFGRDGNGVPAVKLFLDEVQDGLVPRTWWPHTEVGHSQEAKREIQALFPNTIPFSTPKPERLLERILHIGSTAGDVVLDCFLGSGTTGAVAHKMRRRWIGIEREATTLSEFAIPRLQKVLAGDDPGGVTKATGWQGGGGFRLLDVAPSMFTDQDGQVFLSEWATNGKLAEATAAQLSYDYEHDPPLCGRRGRSRLAVIDGLVNDDVVRLISGVLGDGERVVVCGTAVDPSARGALRELRPGSTVRKIPQSILGEYRQQSAMRDARPSAEAELEPQGE